ncbi:cytochrome P450 [Mycena galopus ATCC 62051]|nr:cytochrome P450 [Mycena galopus ATCC 62051]
MSTPSIPIIVLATISVGYLLSRTFMHHRLPPGPSRWPIIGSVLEMPQSYQWLKFSDWVKIYGDLVYLNAFGQSVIVINSAKVARDLLDQRSSDPQSLPPSLGATEDTLLTSLLPPRSLAMSTPFSAIIVLVTISVGYLLSRTFMHHRLPPGPSRWPIIGSVLEMPQSYQWLKFSDWVKIYGDLVYLNAFRQSVIVINSAKVARDLLDQRSSIYSDRPVLAQPMANLYHHIQVNEARKLVYGVANESATLASQTQLTIGRLIARATYGYHISDPQDRFLTLALIGTENFGQATVPGKWAIDFLPICSGFLQVAKGWRELVYKTWDQYLWSKENLESGTVLLPNLIATALDKLSGPPSKEQEEKISWAAAALTGGGLDTSVSSVLAFFLAMTLNPSVQAKARKEIETVIGSDRLPEIQDKDSLPYVRSIMTEILRWLPPIPLAVPHALRQDDVYNDLYLPKGSIVMPNIWHILHDPEIYANPMEFNPDRYQGLNSEMDKVRDIAFGFGRRVCPGKDFADATLFAIVSTVLATCEILPVLDAGGKPILPEPSHTSGAVIFPTPFNCNVKFRHSMYPMWD